MKEKLIKELEKIQKQRAFLVSQHNAMIAAEIEIKEKKEDYFAQVNAIMGAEHILIQLIEGGENTSESDDKIKD